MYVETIPNRNSPPCILIRESRRVEGKVRKRTLANLSKLPTEVIEIIRRALAGGRASDNLGEDFEIGRSQPYGHVAAVLGTLRSLGLDRILDRKPSAERQRVIAMIVARILAPGSKLATARGLADLDTHLGALTSELGLEDVDEEKLYRAMDWLLPRQAAIEEQLAGRHLEEGCLVLYDVTSTYFEGQTCPIAERGYNRDGKKGKLQIVIGLLCNRKGCPVAVEVFKGSTNDTQTVKSQIEKARSRFGLKRAVFVGDRGMLTSAVIEEHLRGQEGLDWISALRGTEIRSLFVKPGFQYSLFDERGLVEIEDPDFPAERLIICKNPLLVTRRANKREDLLRATERKLDAVVKATSRAMRPLRGKEKIALRAGRTLNRFKVAKHFQLEIDDESFSYSRNEEKIAAEARLDGFYVIRTSVPKGELTAAETVEAYKGLSVVERAFRSLKTIDLHIRPIYHSITERVKSHVFLCMLAYYVEWHMRKKLAPLLFDDERPEEGKALRSSVVAPAQRSPSARNKARTKRNSDNLTVNSFQTLLKELASVAKNLIVPKFPGAEPFEKLTSATPLQERALDLLGVRL